MSDFGFKRPGGADAKAKGLDVSGLPSGTLELDPERERDAIQRGEALGFTDRGQSAPEQGRAGRRKRPPPPPSQTLYIRAPQELAEWFERYTEGQGHRALWQSIQDFQQLVEGKDAARSGRAGKR